MVSGYNHNVKYQNAMFHVQTEDSGTQNPHVITHIFIGGTIVATVKTAYDMQIARNDLKAYVTGLMQKQHKAMLKSLIHGTYDASIAQMRGFAAKLDGPAPINVSAGQTRSSFGRQDELPATPGSPPHAPVTPRAVKDDDDAARPSFSHRPPPVMRPQLAPLTQTGPTTLPKTPIPPGEEGYAEAQLIEADDHAVDSLFGKLISEKTLDQVIVSFLGQKKPGK